MYLQIGDAVAALGSLHHISVNTCGSVICAVETVCLAFANGVVNMSTYGVADGEMYHQIVETARNAVP